MDDARERERAAQGAYTRDPDATERRALAARLAELAGKREKLMDLSFDGLFGKDEIARRAALDEEAASVERLLQHARDTAG